jgi:UDP-N-acetylmuramate dehydrogenase
MKTMSVADEELAEGLRRITRGIVKSAEPMSRHTSFGIGGPAAVYVEPADGDDLAVLVGWANGHQVPWWVFGDGANVLVSDKGIRGLAIRMGRPFRKIRVDGQRMVAGSGAKLDKVVSAAVAAGLSGLEQAAGIPGTVGGAIVMNAGTYRGQVGDAVERVSVVTSDGERRQLYLEDLQFRYRWSIFQADQTKIIVEAAFHLAPGDREELVRTAELVRRRRSVNLPAEGRSAGCIFKNPTGDQSAGQLIDQAGLKGARVGGAVVSDKHANFILNMGSATAADVRALAEKVRETVKAKSGIALEYEVRIVGDW